MATSFLTRVEQQIKAASARGELDNLPGAGKPLKSHPEEAVVDAATLIPSIMMFSWISVTTAPKVLPTTGEVTTLPHVAK